MREYDYLSELRGFHRRIKIDSPATIVMEDKQKRTLILRDLSSRGAGIVSGYPLVEGNEVELSFTSPFFHRTITRKAKVVWCRRISEYLWQAGLDFGVYNKLEAV